MPGKRRAGAALALLALTPLCAAPGAWAQRNGDERNGRDYQPTEGEVRSRERADGVAPPAPEQRRETGTVDNLYRSLMEKERADGMTTASPNPNASPGPAAVPPAPAVPARP